jgi:antirestriction protein ArdC
MPTKSAELYDRITARIVERLEAGTVPWRKPWTATDVPRSLSTGKPYQGVNLLLLSCSCYASPYWGTYNAIRERGGQVRRGEKGSPIVFWKFLERPDRDDVEKTRTVPMLRSFTVFNAEQADGLGFQLVPSSSDVDPIEAAERIFELMPNRPCVGFGGDRAYYSPMADEVRLPLRSSFHSSERFYATAFHELVHSTGHEKRLGRGFEGHRFGSADYSREELTAELGAAFLCGRAGIVEEVEEQSAAYLTSWIRALENDHRMIVKAAGAAQKAATFIVGDREPIADELVEAVAA